jgi:diguanylate cyclase (GGDEF)-like protein
LIRASVRSSDVAARVGGDEFAIVLGRTDCDEAQAIGERLIEGVREIALRFPRAQCAASVGLAYLDRPPETFEDLLRRADDAMYRAKAAGKARIVRWPKDEDSR